MTMPQTRHYEMKDSGVEWIGRMPIGWKIVPAKFFMKVQAGYPFDSERFDNSQGIPLIRIRDITSGHTETFYNGDYPEEYVVHNNDLLVGMDGDFNVRWWQGGEAVLNQRCCRILARNGLLLRYFYFLLPFYLKQVNELAYSTTVKHLANGDIGNADICLPPEDEQTAIAAYLDEKCATIDAIIAEAKASIEEYKSWKASVIFETVTKGLNPNAEMKDSGVEWIGEIPKGWNLMPFGKIASIKACLVPPKEYPLLPQISPDNIEKGSARLLQNYKTVQESGVISWNHHFYKGQIIYSKVRPTLNKLFLAQFEGLCSADMYPIETTQDARYLVYAMLSGYFVQQVAAITANRVKMPKINKQELSKITVLLPPLSEQASIVSYLDRKCSLIDGIILEKEDLIRELENYMRSLIFEVVTGKRRVC